MSRGGWRPSRRLPLAVKARNLVRNVWTLRRELLAMLLRRKPPAAPAPIALRCISCGHELTKPCRPGNPCHVFRWPAEVPHPTFTAGQLVYVRRQKPRAGAMVQEYDLRAQPW